MEKLFDRRAAAQRPTYPFRCILDNRFAAIDDPSSSSSFIQSHNSTEKRPLQDDTDEPYSKRSRMDTAPTLSASRNEHDRGLPYREDHGEIGNTIRDSIPLEQTGRYQPALCRQIAQTGPKTGERGLMGLDSVQIDGVALLWRKFIAGYPGVILGDGMGVGKTVQTIAFLVVCVHFRPGENPKDLHQNFPPGLCNQIANSQAFQAQRPSRKVLIVCPASLRRNWKDEFANWMRCVDGVDLPLVQMLTGHRRDEMIDRWNTSGGVLVASYEGLVRLVDAALEPDIIVADEAHRLKCDKDFTITGKCSKKTTIGFNRLTRPEGGKRWPFVMFLTGTPIDNSLKETNPLLYWASGGTLGSNVSEFWRSYRTEDGKRALRAILRNHLMIRRVKPRNGKDYHLTFPLSSKQEELYTMLWRAMRDAEKTAKVEAERAEEEGRDKGSDFNVLAWVCFFSLVCDHPAIFKRYLEETEKRRGEAKAQEQDGDADDDAEEAQSGHALSDDVIGRALDALRGVEFDLAASPKMKATFSLIETARLAGERTLVFSYSLHALDCIEEKLEEMGRNVLRLDGKARAETRVDVMERASRGDFDVMLISIKTGGTGLNLQSASRVILLDWRYNPNDTLQAIARADRKGQEKEVTAYWLGCGGTFEDKSYELSCQKIHLASDILKGEPASSVVAKVRSWFKTPYSDALWRKRKAEMGTTAEVQSLISAVDNADGQTGNVAAEVVIDPDVVVDTDHTPRFEVEKWEESFRVVCNQQLQHIEE